MTLTTEIQSNYRHVFANDPIVIKSAMTSSDIIEGATLHQLVVRVTIYLPNQDIRVHELSQQYVAGDELYYDVSSAFQAEYQLMDRQNEPAPNLSSQSYMALNASIEAYVRYLSDGDERTGPLWDALTSQRSDQNPPAHLYVLRGGLRTYLRQSVVASPSAAVSAFADNLTTKPALVSVSGTPRIFEIKNEGDTHLVSAYNPSTHVITTTATQVVNGSAAGIFSVENDDHRHQIVFRNSLGVLETFSVKNLQKKTLDVESESYPIVSNPSYRPALNLLTEAGFPSDGIEMSTGYLPKEWCEWFIREVLTATYVWVAIPFTNPKTGTSTPVYLPVHLDAADKTILQDDAQPSLTAVKFTLKL